MFVSSGTVRFPPATRRHRLAPSPGPLRAPPPIFSVDTHCSGIHFPPDSLQNPDLSLILRPFVIQKTGINNKLYMTESKWTKKKKGNVERPNKWFALWSGKKKSFFMAAVSHRDVYSRLKWIIISVMWEKSVEQKYQAVTVMWPLRDCRLSERTTCHVRAQQTCEKLAD